MCFLETEDFPGDHEIIKIATDLQVTIELEKKEKE